MKEKSIYATKIDIEKIKFNITWFISFWNRNNLYMVYL